ncbi:hypothetical protein EB796_004369 [Bugula neritina]|uniref:Uncharacterized protein n=1 Tax=Bugula neritina TaxID=10212 RepID=A0A7J7KIU6_BUGNE|nr:hypothetical protein EB796_004369 [Bugula neritina]
MIGTLGGFNLGATSILFKILWCLRTRCLCDKWSDILPVSPKEVIELYGIGSASQLVVDLGLLPYSPVLALVPNQNWLPFFQHCQISYTVNKYLQQFVVAALLFHQP